MIGRKLVATSLAVLLLIGCSEEQNSLKLGHVELNGGGEQIVSLSTPEKKSSQAWRLRFSPSNYDFNNPPAQAKSKVQVFAKNTGLSPLQLSLTEGEKPISLAPGASAKIFEGPVETLFLAGRSMHADFEIMSSGSTQMELRLVPLNAFSGGVSFDIYAIRYREGL